MAMDEKEFNEQLLFYLNELKESELEDDPQVKKFKEYFEDILWMEDIKLEDIAINVEENSDTFKTIFDEFDLRVRAEEGQSLAMYKTKVKKGNQESEKVIILDKGTIVATILAFGFLFEAYKGNTEGMMAAASPLIVYLGSKKFNKDEVIEMLKESYRWRKNKK